LLAGIIESSKGQASSTTKKKKKKKEEEEEERRKEVSNYKKFMTFSISKVDNCFSPR